MYSFSSSGYSDESSPYIVAPKGPSSAPRLAGSQPFRDAMTNEQKRRVDLYAGILDGNAQVQAAQYGQVPTQVSRQPSIGDQLAAGLAKPLGTLAGNLVGGLFGGGGGGLALSSGFNAGTSSAINTGASGWGDAFNTRLDINPIANGTNGLAFNPSVFS